MISELKKIFCILIQVPILLIEKIESYNNFLAGLVQSLKKFAQKFKF